jgi:hypothetical protein
MGGRAVDLPVLFYQEVQSFLSRFEALFLHQFLEAFFKVFV